MAACSLPRPRLVVLTAELAVRRAAGKHVTPPCMALIEPVRELAEMLAERYAPNSFRCKLCSRAALSQRGLILHLKRKHYETILALAAQLLKKHGLLDTSVSSARQWWLCLSGRRGRWLTG